MAAYNLAAQGHDVLIIEAGAHFPSQRITHEERRMTARLFKDGGIQTSRDNDFVVFQAQCVGGGTVINNGIALRVDQPGLIHPDAPDVLAKWASIGAPVDKTAFDAAYLAVETHLGIEQDRPDQRAQQRQTYPRRLGGLCREHRRPPPISLPPRHGFARITARAAPVPPVPIAAIATPAAPMAARMAWHSPISSMPGERARAFSPMLVSAKSCGAPMGRTADGVELTLADGRHRTIKARNGVVVAAGAMASSRILDASGIEGTGQQLSLNIASPVSALMPREMRTWDEDQMASYVDRGDYLIESHFQSPLNMATLLTGWFGDHARKMANYSRLASAGILFPADRKGHVTGNQFSFKLDPETDLPLIRRAIGALVRVHFAGGALEVYPALTRGGTILPGMDIDAFLHERLRESDDVVLSSSHPHGGNAMNEDPALGIVDPDCRVHGTTNVMVTDASVFPSCIRVNAQLTTMAMAQYVTNRSEAFA